MTVSNQTNRTAVVGTATIGQIIPFTFPVTDSDDLQVITRVTATGVENTLTETTDYTVVVTGFTGGTVTMVTAVAVTAEIHVVRSTPITQTQDLEAGGAFNAEIVESAFDKVTKQNVEQQDLIDRTIHAAVTDDSEYSTGENLELPDPDERASCYLTFDANGAVTATTSVVTGTATISTFGESLIDDANASEAQDTLGFSAPVKTILDDATITAVLTTLGFSTFIKTLIDDTTATIARATLEILDSPLILTIDGDVLVYEGEVLTYL